MKIVFPYDGYEHLGIGYLAAMAMQAGHRVELAPLPFRDSIRGRKRISDAAVRDAASAILHRRPDVALFSLNSFTAAAHRAVASALRQRGVKTLAGGPHAVAEPLRTIESGAFDGLVVGEAEEVFNHALEHLATPSAAPPPWLYTEEHREAVRAPLPDLERVPVAEKSLFYEVAPFEAEDYKIITSRGCPFRCIFCGHSSAAGRAPLRRRSIDSVLSELSAARKRFHPSSVYFLDDVFTLDHRWLKELLLRYRQQVGLPFHAITHPQFFNDDVAALLSEAGCFGIRLGVQSLTPHVQRFLGRVETPAQVVDAIAAARRHRLRVEVDHMVNVPCESLEEAREGIAVYNENRPDSIKVYWLVPLPGTAWFSKARESGSLNDDAAEQIRDGAGLGAHSYFFRARAADSERRWLGIHALLSYVPILPRRLVRLLLALRADRFLRIPSFLFLVGLPRLLTLLRGGDPVGKAHLERLLRRSFP